MKTNPFKLLLLCLAWLVFPMQLRAQQTFVKMYNFSSIREVINNVYIYPDEDSILVYINKRNPLARDSTWLSHQDIYKISLKTGEPRYLNTLHKLYWHIISDGSTPNYCTENSFLTRWYDPGFIQEKTFYAMVSSQDNWKTIDTQSLKLPFESYYVSAFCKINNHYIVCGDTGTVRTSKSYFAVLDSNLIPLHIHIYDFYAWLNCIIPVNNGYIISGSRYTDREYFKMMQIRVDSLGNILWKNDYPDSSYDESGTSYTDYFDYKQIIYVGDKSQRPHSSFQKGLILSISEEGDLIYEKYHESYYDISYFSAKKRGKYLYALGYIDTVKYTIPSSYALLSKIDPENGKILWTQYYYQDEYYSYLSDMYHLKDRILLCGSAKDSSRLKDTAFDSDDFDSWLLLVDTNGCIVPGCNPNASVGIQHILNNDSHLAVFPNPVTDAFTLELKNEALRAESYEGFIYTTEGKLLQEFTLPKGQTRLTMQKPQGYSGMAILVLQSPGNRYYKKILIQ